MSDSSAQQKGGASSDRYDLGVIVENEETQFSLEVLSNQHSRIYFQWEKLAAVAGLADLGKKHDCVQKPSVPLLLGFSWVDKTTGSVQHLHNLTRRIHISRCPPVPGLQLSLATFDWSTGNAGDVLPYEWGEKALIMP